MVFSGMSRFPNFRLNRASKIAQFFIIHIIPLKSYIKEVLKTKHYFMLFIRIIQTMFSLKMTKRASHRAKTRSLRARATHPWIFCMMECRVSSYIARFELNSNFTIRQVVIHINYML